MSLRRVALAWTVIAVLLLVQLLAHLRDHYLWQDEAETALVAGTILTSGLPRGTDGKNFFSQVGPAAMGTGWLWTLDPWLPFYLTALFFKIFGVSDWAARLPFALLGVLTVGCSAHLARLLFNRPLTTLFTGGVLVVMVPYLLLVNQARWYSLVMFFSVLSLVGYTAVVRERGRWGQPLLFLALVLLFHSRFAYYYLFLAVIAAHGVCCHRAALGRLALPAAASLLFTIPWQILFSGYHILELHQAGGDNLAPNLLLYGQFLARHILPYPALFVLLVIFLLPGDKLRERAPTSLPEKQAYTLFLLVAVLLISALSWFSGPAFFRYLAPLLPLAAILFARIGEEAWRRHRGGATLCLVVLLLSFSWPSYIAEIFDDYRGPIEGIVTYLNEHGGPDDEVVITYGSLPLKFYTPLRVIGLEIGENFATLKGYPRFIILRKFALEPAMQDYVEEFLMRTPRTLYRVVEVDYPDLPWENRPSPEFHYFKTPPGERVVIHERLDG